MKLIGNLKNIKQNLKKLKKVEFMVEERNFNNIIQLNEKLLETLAKTTLELIKYSKENNYELPYEVHSLLKDARKILNEIDNPTIINKKCSVCSKLNPSNAEYCCFCGSSMIITHVSPDVLHGKRGDSNHPKSDRTQ